MTVLFKNASFLEVHILIGDILKTIPAHQTFEYYFDRIQLPLKIKFSVAETAMVPNPHCLYVSTVVLWDSVDSDGVITIREKAKKYQNYTTYTYLLAECSGQNIADVRYIAEQDKNVSVAENASGKNTQNRFSHLLKIALADSVLDGFLLCVLLAFVFSVKVAVIAFLAVFAVSLTVHLLHHRMTKSKHRFLNWAKDEELPDDIAYLVSHINEFCN